MSLDSDLLDLVHDLVTDSETMSGSGIKAAFEDILYKWADVESVSPTGRGAYVDGQHLAVIEAFFGDTYLETFLNSTTSSNPSYTNGLQLEALYGNMLDSMQNTRVCNCHYNGCEAL